MAAVLRGAQIVEVASGDLEFARRALARAIVTGALGRGYAVSLDGEAVVFEGARSDGASRGRIALHSDGRASFELSVGAVERARVAQGVALAALVSVLGTLLWSWVITAALALGAAFGISWTAFGIVGDRRRLRRDVAAVLRGLPLLVDPGP
jgi:hypothetical protein